jgi:hypothetical protein
MINISNKALEAHWKTYKIKQSPRHEDGTKPDAKDAKKRSKQSIIAAPDPR